MPLWRAGRRPRPLLRDSCPCGRPGPVCLHTHARTQSHVSPTRSCAYTLLGACPGQFWSTRCVPACVRDPQRPGACPDGAARARLPRPGPVRAAPAPLSPRPPCASATAGPFRPPGSSRASGSLDVIKEQAGGPAARTASAPSLGPAPLPTPSLSMSWGDNKRLPSWKVLRTWHAPRSAALWPALPERVWITAISRRGDLGCVGRTPVKQVLRARPGRTWAVHEAGAGAAVRLGTSSAARCGPAGPGPRPR